MDVKKIPIGAIYAVDNKTPAIVIKEVLVTNNGRDEQRFICLMFTIATEEQLLVNQDIIIHDGIKYVINLDNIMYRYEKFFMMNARFIGIAPKEKVQEYTEAFVKSICSLFNYYPTEVIYDDIITNNNVSTSNFNFIRLSKIAKTKELSDEIITRIKEIPDLEELNDIIRSKVNSKAIIRIRNFDDDNIALFVEELIDGKSDEELAYQFLKYDENHNITSKQNPRIISTLRKIIKVRK